MKKRNIICLSLGLFVATNAIADTELSESIKEPKKLVSAKEDVVKVDRSVRANPYANTPSYAQGGDTSRYATDQGWSRGRNSWWWGGGRSSDIASTGYTAPSSR